MNKQILIIITIVLLTLGGVFYMINSKNSNQPAQNNASETHTPIQDESQPHEH